jgi:hypothetical protein
MLNDFPSQRSTAKDNDVPMMTNALESASQIGDNCARGSKTKEVARKVPSRAEMRG